MNTVMNPDLKSLSKQFSNVIEIQGKSYLYFSGTAYLGIPNHEEFISHYLEGIRKYGLNNGTSRTNNIQLGIYEEAENYAAKMFAAPSALIVSSGYLAAQLVVQAYCESGQIMYAPNSHPALWLSTPYVEENTFTEWSGQVVKQINESKETNWVLISNSMNNLVPEIYDFGFLKAIDPTNKITLIVDDSHGFGVNNHGHGAFETLPTAQNINCIVVASMAKALGVDAGIILSSKANIQKLKQNNIFIGASPPAAAGLFAFTQAEKIYKTQQLKLEQNVKKLQNLKGINWTYNNSFPVFLLQHPGIDNQLFKHNILISSFPYPDQTGLPLNRIVLSSWHTNTDIDELSAALKAST